ncbi:NEFA-interacting nuclear NIP30 N-terminal [Pyrenophora seminiperda CCB06]|uniref:NEFA-interacting nuclear NIP30 N-terminal n=1 Tax=Pyrenophora seminiperda CCB06 TaxID=1302712 RepID=A0A3M7M416_9PLEO|nr:NEFA-interacting nuclear NIP30 N-terminal [Pyrenophora seminiperda CCB06]
MSSGFVSGGKAGEETERDDEWKRAQQEIEDARRAKAELARQQDGKSLFEVLQANKDKKQAEFEEKARYKLHVALDDEEADYLDSVLEKKLAEEARVRKETSEQLELFRRQREEEERKARGLEEESSEAPRDEDAGQWAAVGRKRKKAPETGLLKGVKLRKSSSVPEDKKTIGKTDVTNTNNTTSATDNKIDAKSSATLPPLPLVSNTKPSTDVPIAKPANPLSLGLGYASSDDED